MLHGTSILLGISASIAAYKSLELIRLLQKAGVQVYPCLTRAAQDFVTPLSVEALAKKPILSQASVFDAHIAHVEAAHACQIALIAPASANCIAKMAHGFGDDILYQTLLSFNGPVLIAPAMEHNMWHHPATQANVATLKSRGVVVIDPENGALASGRTGDGRMAEIAIIIDAAKKALSPQDFAGKKILINAGPTVEDIDPARFLSNRSSGKMGVAISKAFMQRGAHVTLVHGPMQAKASAHHCIAVRSAVQMADAMLSLASQMDIIVACAAVADYRPVSYLPHKHKKSDNTFLLELQQNPDILESLGTLSPKPFLVGFAAESDTLLENAITKCQRKNCDIVCVNDISPQNSAFEADTNAIHIVDKNGLVQSLGMHTKEHIAHQLLDVIFRLQK